MARICLLTPGQPSVNPRVVKEADTLFEAGHEIHLLCSHYVGWADKMDATLLRDRRWSCIYVGGRPDCSRTLYYWTRLRHGVARRTPWAWELAESVGERALSRVVPELKRAAVRVKADLYIAHYTGGLVAGAEAAEKNGALLAFDAEDFEPGGYAYDVEPGPADRLIERMERRYLARCAYITAASPGIAHAYREKYDVPEPVPILNVFTLTERPETRRTSCASEPLRLYWFSQTIGPDRGLEDVVRAMGKLGGCRMELHLRGRCSAGYAERLLGLAGSVGVRAEQVQFHPPAAPNEMTRLAADYDVGLALEHPVSQVRDVCLTNKIFTYILAGNAVAATATKGQRPIVETIGAAGFGYKPGDVDMLAAGLRRWYKDRDLLQRAREESWEWGTRRFNWEIEKLGLLRTVKAALGSR